MRQARLLYVDDDDVHRLIVSNLIFMEPHLDIVTTDTAQDALNRLVKGEKFDALLVDWNMPGMCGYRLVRAVRSNQNLDHVRILMVTINNEMEHVKQALKAGANEYLMKPFTKEILLSKINLLLMN